MTVHELNRDELRELKENYLCEIMDKRNGETPSYYELANADELVTDEEIFNFYAGTYFVKDDFVCNLMQVN